MDVEAQPPTLKQALSYAKQRQESDRRWSTTYWFLHNLCIGAGLVSQLVVVFGLALMLYVPEARRASANVVLLLVSLLGFVLALLDVLHGFNRRSRLLSRTADSLELSLALYADGRLTPDQFEARLKEMVSLRQQQHDD